MTQKLKFDQNFYLKYFFLLLCFEINKLILNSVAQIHKGSSNCKGEDSLSNCPRFLILSNASSKVKVLPKFMICYNFFHFGHFANPCKKQGCKIFKRRSTLLSKTINTHSTTWHLPENPSSARPRNRIHHHRLIKALCLQTQLHPTIQIQHDVLLSTAFIKLCDTNNHEQAVCSVLESVVCDYRESVLAVIFENL